MKQLSGIDYSFLHQEKGNQYMHVAGLGIYDPSTAPGGMVRFKDILRFFADRIESVPLFRRRLVTVPNGIDRPYWLEDANIDVEFHVRHIALPYPGDWRQLCIQVARIHSRPLDRSKPLWEAYVIEGLDNIPGLPEGSFALYIKFHHSAVDGEAGTEILQAIHSLQPESGEREGPAHRAVQDREPSRVELYSRAVLNYAARVPALGRFSVGLAGKVLNMGKGYLEEVSRGEGASSAADLGLDTLTTRPPATRFARPVSAHRVVEAVGFPLEELKAMRKMLPDVTINDLFMTIVGGALNKYLASKGELPAESLTAMVPMSVRTAEMGSDVGNQIGFTVMPVHSEIGDALQRLKANRDDAQKAKRLAGAMGKDLAKQLYDQLPSVATELFTKYVMVPQMSIVVSNVRGPDVPLYMAGARLVNFAPISIVINGLGLNTTAFSYNGVMWICAVSCRDIMPDPGFFADCLRGSFADLEEALKVQVKDARVEMPEAAGKSAVTSKVAGTPRARGALRKKGVLGGKGAGRKLPPRKQAEAKPVTETSEPVAPAAKPAPARKRASKKAPARKPAPARKAAPAGKPAADTGVDGDKAAAGRQQAPTARAETSAAQTEAAAGPEAKS